MKKQWYDGLTEMQIDELKNNDTVLCGCPLWMQRALKEMPRELTGTFTHDGIDFGYFGTTRRKAYFLHKDFQLQKPEPFKWPPVCWIKTGESWSKVLHIDNKNRYIETTFSRFRFDKLSCNYEYSTDLETWHAFPEVM